MQLGVPPNERPRFVEGQIFCEHLEGFGDERFWSEIDTGQQSLVDLIAVFLGKRVRHVRPNLNI